MPPCGPSRLLPSGPCCGWSGGSPGTAWSASGATPTACPIRRAGAASRSTRSRPRFAFSGRPPHRHPSRARGPAPTARRSGPSSGSISIPEVHARQGRHRDPNRRRRRPSAAGVLPGRGVTPGPGDAAMTSGPDMTASTLDRIRHDLVGLKMPLPWRPWARSSAASSTARSARWRATSPRINSLAIKTANGSSAPDLHGLSVKWQCIALSLRTFGRRRAAWSSLQRGVTASTSAGMRIAIALDCVLRSFSI